MAGFTIPRAFVSMDPWSGTLLVGMPRGVTLPDGRDVGGYSLRKYADEREKTDWRGEEAIRVTLDDGFPARLQRGRGDDVEAVFVDASVLADAVKTRLDSALRAAEDMDWTPDFGFAALEQVADTEPSTMDIPPLPEPAETEPPMDDGTDTDPFADVRVRRAIPWKAIGITVAALLAVGLMAGGGVMLARHHGEETARRTLAQATADCRQAHDTAGRQRDALEQAVEKARRLTSATGKDQVTDQSTLDALDKLAGKAIPKLPSCPASDPDTGRVSTAGKEYKRRTQALRDAMDKVNRSILDKTVKDAKKLHDESAGKVADESTRTDLAKAMESRDADAIRKAMDKVNRSIKAKQDDDKAKEEEAQAQAAQQQARQSQQSVPSTGGQTTRRSGGSTYGGTTGRTYGGTTGRTTTPAPSAPSTPSTPTPQPAPSTPSKPSGTDGATVG